LTEYMIKTFIASGITILLVSYITNTKIDLKTVIISELVCGGVHYAMDSIEEK
jgi:hypothetical protein